PMQSVSCSTCSSLGGFRRLLDRESRRRAIQIPAMSSRAHPEWIRRPTSWIARLEGNAIRRECTRCNPPHFLITSVAPPKLVVWGAPVFFAAIRRAWSGDGQGHGHDEESGLNRG